MLDRELDWPISGTFKVSRQYSFIRSESSSLPPGFRLENFLRDESYRYGHGKTNFLFSRPIPGSHSIEIGGFSVGLGQYFFELCNRCEENLVLTCLETNPVNVDASRGEVLSYFRGFPGMVEYFRGCFKSYYLDPTKVLPAMQPIIYEDASGALRAFDAMKTLRSSLALGMGLQSEIEFLNAIYQGGGLRSSLGTGLVPIGDEAFPSFNIVGDYIAKDEMLDIDFVGLVGEVLLEKLSGSFARIYCSSSMPLRGCYLGLFLESQQLSSELVHLDLALGGNRFLSFFQFFLSPLDKVCLVLIERDGAFIFRKEALFG